jgi:hypothetical protein
VSGRVKGPPSPEWMSATLRVRKVPIVLRKSF